ncbi:uncharacterized protein DSM5745_08444 [Aspergillus mulundensis]|uniref:Uncharacterized protein n=1 Tax=Aspergillus mulundensis TaxID=1810919 RepID=A0A3D8R4D6_9EURO|nr:Uncharacterized protein DSM5745_08444 [Aspergillus mulundensis]RDW68684.1 Uncharacterized protein DSM5745_08444 [Aspergillus mulundensis]
MPNPINIAPRFEIRKLEPQHLEWAKAIISHSNVFHSPVWAKLYPENQAERFRATFNGATYLVQHQIDSGLSYGVFDTEYQFKRPESAAKGGAMYWEDEWNPSFTGDDILARMDFPLASIALAFDAADPIDMQRVAPLFKALPHFPVFAPFLDARDTRDPAHWEAKGPGEVLKRMGTATRADYMDSGITKSMAHWLMWDAAEKGFRGINIECYHDAVNHIWTRPPPPFKADLVAKVRVNEYEKEENGRTVRPFPHVAQALTKVYVHLR